MSRVLETPPVERSDPPQPDPAAPAIALLEGAAAAPELPARPSPARAGPRLPRWRWLFRAGLALLLIPGAVLAGAEMATPAVSGAPVLVAAIDRAHGSAAVPAAPSWRVSEAIVAAEDGTFYSNDGIDVAGVGRAFWGWLTGADEGGSTITAQLAKVLYTGGHGGIAAGVGEVALALKLDGHYTKAAILSMYLSAIYFGNGYYGVLAASEGYFGLTPDRLSWAQASLLAGLPQAPSLLDPLQHLALARHRQSYVLARLVATGALSRAQAEAAATAPLDLR
ncbi:MAG: biosynthetic peptidoglycan transglycosylase [Candidatus Dormibacteria bacterium]